MRFFDIQLEAKSTVMLEACSFQALMAISPARADRPSSIDRRLMASSISNHSQLSHLHASSMTVDLASSRMSLPTDVGSTVLGACLETKSVGFNASHCQA
jgi:hypothetical protein